MNYKEYSEMTGDRKLDLLWKRETEKFCDNCLCDKKCGGDINDCLYSHTFEKHFEDILDLF